MNGKVDTKIIALAIVAGMISANEQARAQEPPKEFTLKVTQPELELISEGLQTQPFGKVFPVINKLSAQINEQRQPPKPVEKTEEAKPIEPKKD